MSREIAMSKIQVLFAGDVLVLQKLGSGDELLRSAVETADQWRTQEFFFFWGGGVQQIQLRTEGRENGDLGAVAP